MGASVQSAFNSGGGTFAICATVIVSLGLGLQLWTASSLPDSRDEFVTILRYGMPNLLGCTLLIVGGFLDEGPRKILWVTFVLTLLGAMQIGKFGDWIVRAGHFAERHGLIIIIALGEIVVAIGISVVDSLGEESGLPTPTLLGLIAAGIMAALLWWSYFDRVQPGLEHRGEELEGRDRARFAADVYTLTHIPLVVGIIAMAATTEEILLYPKDTVHAEFLVMFVAGFALFFGGIALAAYIAFRAVAIERAAGIVAIALLAVLGKSLGGVTLLILVDLIIVVTLIFEHIRIERPQTGEVPAAPAVADATAPANQS